MPTSIGLEATPYAEFLVQVLGTFNISISVLAFLVSGMAHTPARQAVVTFFFVQQVLSVIVTLLAVLGDVIPGGAGWFGICFNLVFALAFGYFSFIQPEASLKAGAQS